jgi:hypothetical protein
MGLRRLLLGLISGLLLLLLLRHMRPPKSNLTSRQCKRHYEIEI